MSVIFAMIDAAKLIARSTELIWVMHITGDCSAFIYKTSAGLLSHKHWRHLIGLLNIISFTDNNVDHIKHIFYSSIGWPHLILISLNNKYPFSYKLKIFPAYLFLLVISILPVYLIIVLYSHDCESAANIAQCLDSYPHLKDP